MLGIDVVRVVVLDKALWLTKNKIKTRYIGSFTAIYNWLFKHNLS